MKAQDILFFVLISFLLIFLRKPKVIAILGLVSIILSIPLFQFWIFFTAQRLVWYGVGLIFMSIILLTVKNIVKLKK